MALADDLASAERRVVQLRKAKQPQDNRDELIRRLEALLAETSAREKAAQEALRKALDERAAAESRAASQQAGIGAQIVEAIKKMTEDRAKHESSVVADMPAETAAPSYRMDITRGSDGLIKSVDLIPIG